MRFVAKVRHWGRRTADPEGEDSTWRLCLCVALGGQERLETWGVGGSRSARVEELQEDVELEGGE